MLGALGELSPVAEVRVRHGAAGERLSPILAEVLGDAASATLDGPGPGSSQAGASWSLLDRMGDDTCEELVLVGAEADEIGVVHWRR